MEFSPADKDYPVSPEEDGFDPTVEEMLQELPPIPDNLRGDPVPPGVKRVVEEGRRKILAEMRGTPYALPLARAASTNLLDQAMIAAYIITPRRK
jgi:hypothetical protein